MSVRLEVAHDLHHGCCKPGFGLLQGRFRMEIRSVGAVTRWTQVLEIPVHMTCPGFPDSMCWSPPLWTNRATGKLVSPRSPPTQGRQHEVKP